MNDTNADFDKVAGNYYEESKNELGRFSKYRDTAFIYKAQLLKHILKDEPKSILDFGCGIGLNIPYLHEEFKNSKLYGCDVSSASIEIAKKNYKYCDFRIINNAVDLEIYRDIDCIFISTVLHHIPENEHKYWINGLYNILTEREWGGGGGIL